MSSTEKGAADQGAADEGAGRGDESVWVVDSHSLIFQVFHAIGDMTSPRGEPVNAGDCVRVSGAVTRALDRLGLLDPADDGDDPQAAWREAIGGDAAA